MDTLHGLLCSLLHARTGRGVLGQTLRLQCDLKKRAVFGRWGSEIVFVRGAMRIMMRMLGGASLFCFTADSYPGLFCTDSAAVVSMALSVQTGSRI